MLTLLMSAMSISSRYRTRCIVLCAWPVGPRGNYGRATPTLAISKRQAATSLHAAGFMPSNEHKKRMNHFCTRATLNRAALLLLSLARAIKSMRDPLKVAYQGTLKTSAFVGTWWHEGLGSIFEGFVAKMLLPINDKDLHENFNAPSEKVL